MKDEPLRVCPSCGKAIRRVVSGGAGVIYKGSGFYNTDKAAKEKKEKKEAAPCGAKESKPACANCPAAGAA